MLKSEFKAERKKQREREGREEEKGKKAEEKRGSRTGGKTREAEWTARLQTLQRSTNTCKEAPQFKWIATAEKKKKRKYTEQKPNPAERLEMSRIRSAKTICSGINRSTPEY